MKKAYIKHKNLLTTCVFTVPDAHMHIVCTSLINYTCISLMPADKLLSLIACKTNKNQAEGKSRGLLGGTEWVETRSQMTNHRNACHWKSAEREKRESAVTTQSRTEC